MESGTDTPHHHIWLSELYMNIYQLTKSVTEWYSGRIALQQQANHFQITSHRGNVDGVDAQLRGRKNWKEGWGEYGKQTKKRWRRTESSHTTIIAISNIYQLTSFFTDTVGGSHSNRTRTTPSYRIATWMGSNLPWDEDEIWENVFVRVEVRNKLRKEREQTGSRNTPHNHNIYQLTSPSADTVEGSHSNRKRTTSRWPARAAMWIGRSPRWGKEEIMRKGGKICDWL